MGLRKDDWKVVIKVALFIGVCWVVGWFFIKLLANLGFG